MHSLHSSVLYKYRVVNYLSLSTIKNIMKKLSLNKKTISALTSVQSNSIVGGRLNNNFPPKAGAGIVRNPVASVNCLVSKQVSLCVCNGK